jgi:hypothetical protein
MHNNGVERMMLKKKVQSLGDGTAIWIDAVGAPSERVFKIIKEIDREYIVIGFSPKEEYQIKKAHIRAKRLIMYKLSSGKVVTQNPDDWSKVDLEKQGIKELRFNLQNFGLQESKAAQHRWVVPLSKMEKLIPLFKLMFICIAVGVIGWSAFKFMTFLFTKISASALIDCATIIPRAPIPIGAMNITTPIGAI